MREKRKRFKETGILSDDSEIRKCQNNIEKLEEDLKNLVLKQSKINLDVQNKKDQIHTTKTKLHQLRNPATPKVSEHALVRFFERIKGYDLKEIKNELLNDQTLSMLKTLGSTGTYPYKEFKMVFRDNNLVTIINQKEDEEIVE